jgi:hypothetical protein
MASPLKTGKKSVDLAAPAVRGSRIRRDPPPKLKQITIEERNERDRRMAIIGIVAFALAIFVITIGFTSWAGWSPSQYTIHLNSL